MHALTHFVYALVFIAAALGMDEMTAMARVVSANVLDVTSVKAALPVKEATDETEEIINITPWLLSQLGIIRKEKIFEYQKVKIFVAPSR